ncbi:hypothetical protein ABK040_002254 [Willaertia magna]
MQAAKKVVSTAIKTSTKNNNNLTNLTSDEKHKKLVLFLYKNLLRICKRFDEQPALKHFLVNPRHTQSKTMLTRAWTKSNVGSYILSRAYKHKFAYLYTPTVSWQKICKSTFRSSESVRFGDNTALEACFGALSEMNIAYDQFKETFNKEPSFIPESKNSRQSLLLDSEEELLNENIENTMNQTKEVENNETRNFPEINEGNKEILKEEEESQIIPNDIKDLKFNIIRTVEPKAFHFLLAHPMLNDPGFDHTCVILRDNKQRYGKILGKRFHELPKKKQKKLSRKEKEKLKKEEELALSPESFLQNNQGSDTLPSKIPLVIEPIEENPIYSDTLEDDGLEDEDFLSPSGRGDTLNEMATEVLDEIMETMEEEYLEGETKKRARLKDASWRRNQLQHEIQHGTWLVVECNNPSLFAAIAERKPFYEVYDIIVDKLSEQYHEIKCWKDFPLLYTGVNNDNNGK